MPIVYNNNEPIIEYHIPEDIIQRIPPEFYEAFLHQLQTVFKHDITYKDEETDWYGFEFCEGTGGWYEALKTTCEQMNMKWLFDDYNKLEWYDSDLFDDQLSQLIIKNICG